MGEPIVAASNDEYKMEKTHASNSALEVSISFGRFENDSLSWEKWSSFSPNKYLEEVEKCATPGSVAKKAAYFEAHYKKIAARKAEQPDQGKQMVQNSTRSDDQNSEDLLGRTSETDTVFDVPNNQTSIEAVREEMKLASELDSGNVDGSNEDAAMNSEVQDLPVESMENELDSRLDSPSLNKAGDFVLVKEEDTPSIEYQEVKELPNNSEKETESIPVIEGVTLKADHLKVSKKVAPMSKVRDIAKPKKKPVSPVPQTSISKVSMPMSPKVVNPKVLKSFLSQTVTPKVSKTVSTSDALSSSQSSIKKVTGSPLARKNSSTRQSKKVAPKALHMSLSLDPPNSEPNLDPVSITTTRKPLIMEKMKDKEIVKRAFKTFQNNFNKLRSSSEERASGAKQVPAKGTEVTASTSLTSRKENEGSLKAGDAEKRTAKAAPTSPGLRNDERADRRKEFVKKLEDKPNVKVAESARLRTKSKEEKEAEIKRLRQNSNFKATPMPAFYRGQRASRGPLDKEGSKTLRI